MAELQFIASPPYPTPQYYQNACPELHRKLRRDWERSEQDGAHQRKLVTLRSAILPLMSVRAMLAPFRQKWRSIKPHEFKDEH